MNEKIGIPASGIEEQKIIMRHIRESFESLQTPPLAYVDTYGCQQNEADSEKLRGMLSEMGYVITNDEYVADVVVINTCAIRENAENRVLGNVGELIHTKKAKPSQIIAFCGCLAGVPETVEKVRQSYRHVDLVFTPGNIPRFPELLRRKLSAKGRIFETEIEDGEIAEGIPLLRDGNVKAWLPIMYGCDNYCTYCIVPYVRGRERSRSPAAVIGEARTLVENGYKDITLLGQNVNSYGAGLAEKTNFAALIRQINDIDGEFLIRFMTSHPKDASVELFRAMAESGKAARHIHLPFQAGNDRILELMNRGYTHAGYLEKVAAARELMPDIVITSDVIVGFPGETDREFEDTLRLVEKARFDAMFTFIYSKRPGTPAAELPDTVTRGQKQLRFERLIELQNRISDEKHARYVGGTFRVLVDEKTQDEQPATSQPRLPPDGAVCRSTGNTTGQGATDFNSDYSAAAANPDSANPNAGSGAAGRYTLKARTNGGRLVHLRGGADLVGTFVSARITHCNSWSLFGEVL